MVNHLFDKGLRSFQSIFPQKCERTAGDWSLPERGGIGSVIELAMAKQVYQKINHFTT